ncbi:MAG TPA: sugar ABC transporter substrate-binding protein [bacterium]|nr:sugar ABC transporter substrate-binding protein [bacterium]
MPRRFVRVAALAAVLALAGTLLPGPGAARAAGPTTIEFWTISLQPFFTKFITGMIDDYQRAHPDIRIRWIDVQPQALDQKLLSAIAGGVPPDVVNLNTETTLRLAEARALVDMDAAVPPAARDRYFPNIWGSMRLDGHAYGVPWYVTPDVLAYNQALFRKAGLDPTKPPATTEQWIRAAAVIKKKAGVYGFMPNVDGIRFLKVFQEEGLPVLGPDRKHAAFGSAAHVALLARYVDLYKHDQFPDDTLRRGYLGATERFGDGQLAMLTTGPQFLLRVRSDNPDVYRDTAVAPAPMGRGGVLDLPTMDLAVPVASRHRNEAVAFALYVTNDANQLAFCKQVVIFPSTKAAAADPYFTRGGSTPEDRARLVAVRELGQAKDLTVVVPHSDELYRVFREAIESAFYGKMSAGQALEWAVREWNRRL